MHTDLESRWNDLEKARAEFLGALEGWSDQQLRARPSEGWSANQVLEHILSAETGTLGYMMKKSSSGWDILEKTGDEHIAKSRAANSRLESPEKYPAPSVLPEPTNEYSLEQLRTQWDRLREQMKEFLLTIEPQYFDRLVFRQPVAGMLNVLQALEFMYYHIRHHLPQLERIKAQRSS